MNNKFRDFISTFSTDVLKRIRIEENRLFFPANLEIEKFEKLFKEEINSLTLTNEKALYLAQLNTKPKLKSVTEELFNFSFNK